MTTNQTIDGVPRELLERAVQAIINTSQMHPALEELRALLDAESSPCAKSQVKPVARPLGNTVTFPRELTDELAELIAEKARVCGGGAFEIWEAICEQFGKPDQPAPVALVIPRRKPVTGTAEQKRLANEWNSCVAEFDHLNKSPS